MLVTDADARDIEGSGGRVGISGFDPLPVVIACLLDIPTDGEASGDGAEQVRVFVAGGQTVDPAP